MKSNLEKKPMSKYEMSKKKSKKKKTRSQHLLAYETCAKAIWLEAPNKEKSWRPVLKKSNIKEWNKKNQ